MVLDNVIQAFSEPSDVRKISYSAMYELIKKQKLTYSQISDICLSMLTPIEKDMVTNFINMKDCYLTNVSQLENGKVISIFIPQFEIKSFPHCSTISSYLYVFKKQNGELVNKEYRFSPRLVEVGPYDNIPISKQIGMHNGFGWEVVDVRLIEKKHWSQELLY